MEIVNKILDMVSQWPPVGQGIFLVAIASMILWTPVSVILGTLRYIVVFFRGWPPTTTSSN